MDIFEISLDKISKWVVDPNSLENAENERKIIKESVEKWDISRLPFAGEAIDLINDIPSAYYWENCEGGCWNLKKCK